MNPFSYFSAVDPAEALAHANQGARFIADQIIRVTETAFDDFAGGGDAGLARRMLGLDRNLAEATPRRPK